MLAGRVFLLTAGPMQMPTFPMPEEGGIFDALAGATPLAAVKYGAAGDIWVTCRGCRANNRAGTLLKDKPMPFEASRLQIGGHRSSDSSTAERGGEEMCGCAPKTKKPGRARPDRSVAKN